MLLIHIHLVILSVSRAVVLSSHAPSTASDIGIKLWLLLLQLLLAKVSLVLLPHELQQFQLLIEGDKTSLLPLPKIKIALP